ncbi:MlaC/ttg2D family ABC transporter substrate-binding protein [Agaribacter marinus]|uniref:Organic solvent ABC transporter substrate-binding protein n=1 Tax=Agaribacter marinus TaxID=1431249 RepID=A0AA37T2Q3_9ALTE|nr:ABC transporter substrate-binding protein [Agaribacter marinus]GLR72855.1 organic solvent ABC transporter substrate-binding protein [Agaribacter marinus]
MNLFINNGIKQFSFRGFVFIAALLFANLVSAQDVEKEDPYQMVQDVASKTFERIKKQQDKIKADPEILRAIMEDELMPYINYRFSAYKVLGKYARNADKKDLLEFITVFRQYLITSYAVAMGYYDDQVVEFEPAKSFDDRTDVTVRAVIKDDGRPDIKVAFKVRKDRKSNEWAAYDMIAEGISLLSSKQSEFEEVLRKDGIQKVIALMRESISQPIQLEATSEASTGS